MNLQEDITIERVTNILRFLTEEYTAHLAQCRLCQPGQWLCPTAHDFLAHLMYWDKRLVSMLPPDEEGGGTRP